MPTLSDIFNYSPEPESNGAIQSGQAIANNLNQAELKAKREWYGAIAALEKLLLPLADHSSSSQLPDRGVLLSGPTPVLSQAKLASRFQTGVFKPEAIEGTAYRFQLPAASGKEAVTCSIAELSLSPNDPLAAEQFCLAFTAQFGLVLLLGKDAAGKPAFQFSFDPKQVQQAWAVLRLRLLAGDRQQLQRLEALNQQFAPPVPNYRIVMEFSRQLLDNLPSLSALDFKSSQNHYERQRHPSNVVELASQRSKQQQSSQPNEIELLQAIAHEVRTPLTTIRTLARSLLKRANLSERAAKRLETIDQECTEQIDRMELIFRAAELATAPQQQMHLTAISLEDLFEQSIPRWKKQAHRRGVLLNFVLPKRLPTVVSDPCMLDRVLTGLMEKLTRSLHNGEQIIVRVTTAGNQLKLQLLADCNSPSNPLRSLGQLLMFQPETGSLSLNLDVTKNLFHSMGGKLIVRQRPQQGEVLTIFLPLVSPSDIDTQADVLQV